jgi:DNA-binding transcriptional MerR regulator
MSRPKPVQTFEFREMIRVLGMSAATGKNWTVGRPFKLEPSIRTATGHGSRNLYSLEDVWLMGVANELSKAGMAANAIGKLIDAVRMKFPAGLCGVHVLYACRGPKQTYRIETREDRLAADTVVRIAIDVRRLRDRLDREVGRLRRG